MNKAERYHSPLISLSVIFFLLALLFFVSIKPASSKIISGAEYLIIFSPWSTIEENYMKAASIGARPIRTGYFDFIMIAAFDKEQGFDEVFDDSILFIGDPSIKGGCFFESKNKFVEI